MKTRLRRHPRIVAATGLVLLLVAGLVVAVNATTQIRRIQVVAYFDNSVGLFAGDDVLIRGVPVGKIVNVEPQPLQSKITFWFDRKYKVPADAKAAILSPQLVTGRYIQLTPPYTSGPTMADSALIPKERTVVPIEWDDLRVQLQRLTDMLKPSQPGGVSTLGALINTAADNLRGQGPTIRDTIVKLSKTVSALGDHSHDIFATMRNLSTLVSALHDSTDLLEQLNYNLAAVSASLANDPNKIGQALEDLNAVVGDLKSFTADNREALGTTSDKLTSISNVLVDSLDDLKQTLHVAPTGLSNFVNLYRPAYGGLSGILAANNFANPIQFLCGAVQAASRVGGEQASRLCAQYLAPIVKNRQYNFPPLGMNLLVGAQARPNEVAYSEDWMRPDYVPPAIDSALPAEAPNSAASENALADALHAQNSPTDAPPVAASEGETVNTDPAAGLPGLMLPQGAG